MSSSILKNKLIQEINLIPMEKLSEVYDFIHYFRLGTEKERTQSPDDLLAYSGAWNEMDSDIFDDFMLEIKQRRRKAFSDRRHRETVAD